MSKWGIFPAVLLGLTLGGRAHADLQLPSIIGDNMVLQQQTDDALWGWDAPGTTVSVTFRGVTRSAQAAADGKWLVRLPAGAAGGPFPLHIAGSTTRDLANVLVGEVWIAGGQSNMWWHVAGCLNAPDEIKAANYPQIRYWDANTSPVQGGWPADTPQKTVQATWKETSPQTVADYAGVPYFFARDLYRARHVPVGIVHVAVPGVDIETFQSKEFIQANMPLELENLDLRKKLYPQLKQDYEAAHQAWQTQKAEADKKGEKAPEEPKAPADPSASAGPSVFYNGMIFPTAPFTCRGFLWWQGENNAGRFLQYRVLFPALIQEWRQLWGQENAPFLFVELANFLDRQTKPVEEQYWPNQRDAQRAALRLPGTYEISTIDILPDSEGVYNIHPKNKQLAGHRLFLAAMANVYGVPGTVWSGPVYRSVIFQGSGATVSFDHLGGGLAIRGAGPLKGFALAGPDHQFFWAQGQIRGNTIVLHSKDVLHPVAVRYDWANNPIGNVYNKEGLPAFPFRSDQWNIGVQGP